MSVVPGYTQYGLAERLLIDGVPYTYEDYLGVWQGPGHPEVLPSQIHAMILSGRHRIERAK